ncbi:hypothetical protein LUZ60_007057 [Juncus effusus]|nr:hypothetical protein LUZ60_007057 [Juncus effusus]
MQENSAPNEPAPTFSYKFPDGDRRLAFSRHMSFRQWDPAAPPSPARPQLGRSDSAIGMPLLNNDRAGGDERKGTWIGLMNGSRPMKRLALMISLNVAYSMIELLIGLFTGRVGLVSDAFHLTFGCGLLTFSLFAMGVSRRKPDEIYTYGYKRLEVLAAFTNSTVVSPFFIILTGCRSSPCLHAR